MNNATLLTQLEYLVDELQRGCNDNGIPHTPEYAQGRRDAGTLIEVLLRQHRGENVDCDAVMAGVGR